MFSDIITSLQNFKRKKRQCRRKATDAQVLAEPRNSVEEDTTKNSENSGSFQTFHGHFGNTKAANDVSLTTERTVYLIFESE